MVTLRLSSSSSVYVTDMKKMYAVDPGSLNAMDWFVILAAGGLTLLTLATFVYWVFKLFIFLMRVRSGTASIRDGRFWKRMVIVLLLLFALMTGLAFTIFGSIYGSLLDWGWRST